MGIRGGSSGSRHSERHWPSSRPRGALEARLPAEPRLPVADRPPRPQVRRDPSHRASRRTRRSSTRKSPRLDALGGKTADPAVAPADARTALDRSCKDTFGTPAASKIASDDPDVRAMAERLGLTPDSSHAGRQALPLALPQCHNLTGDGRGPAGTSMYPYPRDYPPRPVQVRDDRARRASRAGRTSCAR